jgi:hypothetical protein
MLGRGFGGQFEDDPEAEASEMIGEASTAVFGAVAAQEVATAEVAVGV